MAARAEKVATDRMIAKLCRESYYQFFLEFAPLVFAERLILNWHIQYLCDELQLIAERVFRSDPKEYDFICNCPPGSSKSTIFSILFQPWTWTRMPSARHITGSHAESLALDLSRKSRDVVLSDKYKRYFPEIQLREDQNTKSYWINSAGGFRLATGVGGSVIGKHAHFLFMDDPIDPQGAGSDLDLKRSVDWQEETLSQRKVDRQVSVMGLVQQRLHQYDNTGATLEKGGRNRHVCLPADNSWPIEPKTLIEKYKDQDGLFDPVRFPRSVLDEEFKKLGELGYAGQYGQQPSPRSGSMFKIDRFVRKLPSEVPSKWKRGPVRFWDKAASQGTGSFTVGVKMAMDFEERIWILDVLRGRWESGERERQILRIAALDGVRCRIGVEQEPGGSGKEAALNAIRSYAKAGYRAYVDVVRGSKEERAGGTMNNEMRADTLSTQVNTYNVCLIEGAPWLHEFVEEFRLFPNSRYKDQVDAATGAYSMISKQRLRLGVFK